MTDERSNPSAKGPAQAKKSQFERQKAEAEAKRARDKAETAAVYEDFVKSFEHETPAPISFSTPSGKSTGFQHGAPGSGASGGGVPSKRHFSAGMMRTSAIDNLGRPPKKRPFEMLREPHRDRDHDRDRPRGVLTFENSAGPTHTAAAFQTSDDEEDKTIERKEAEKAAAKPTLHLSSLPPGTSPAVIKALIPPLLTIDNVKILPPPPSSHTHGVTERRIWSAIITVVKETAATDMDTVVSALQNKYLGWGFYLSISRHLSSAAINSTVPVTSGLASLTNQPFGARPVKRSHYGRGSHRGGFAPPSSYGGGYGSRGPSLQVDVKPPSDLKQLKLIHKTIENLLTHGPEFEALLMSRPEVQREERWAWIWSPKSVGGVWYRWKLWDILTNPDKKAGRGRGHQPSSTLIFDHGPSWIEPEKNLQFEFSTKLDEFVSDEDYDSSDEDDSDRDEEKRVTEDGTDSIRDGKGHLNPLQKAKLTHLLARLPTAHSKLRRGDVARITAFAITHAGDGGDEVVEMIVYNVLKPFAYTNANPERQHNENEARDSVVKSDMDGSKDTDNLAPGQGKKTVGEKMDTSSASLVGLYIISDILSSSSTSGVRHAWRYRQLFEHGLKNHKVFERLGHIEKDLEWGRMKIEKWRRSIGILLGLWEGWCVFPQEGHEYFVKTFEQPPPAEKEIAEEKQRVEAQKEAAVFAGKVKSKWKTVEDTSDRPSFNALSQPKESDPMEVDVDVDAELDGDPIPDDSDYLGDEPMSDIDGIPMEDSDLEYSDGAPLADEQTGDLERDGQAPRSPPTTAPSARNEAQPEVLRKPRRPKAEDMFADSDSEA
ncbi:hypothetical protein FQN57_007295 [Myotisia sp. PD_48]|nr:hypothetical protein FQN57_007295 [Myotisia sp. PD_48]